MIELFPMITWLWIAVYSVITVIHASHILNVTRLGGLWHIGHVIMCSGMVAMFLPAGLRPVPVSVWVAIFSTFAALMSTIITREFVRGQPIDSLWFLSLIDQVAMIYMFIAAGSVSSILTNGLAIYFTVEMFGWLTGAFDDDGNRGRFIPAKVGTRRSITQESSNHLAEVSSNNVRVTSGLMAAGMAYMFIMMNYGP